GPWATGSAGAWATPGPRGTGVPAPRPRARPGRRAGGSTHPARRPRARRRLRAPSRRSLRESEDAREELVGSAARLWVVGDRDDHQLVYAVRLGQRAQAVAHLGGGAGDRAPARLLDDAELARRVRVRLGLLDRGVAPRAARG